MFGCSQKANIKNELPIFFLPWDCKLEFEEGVQVNGKEDVEGVVEEVVVGKGKGVGVEASPAKVWRVVMLPGLAAATGPLT